MFEQGIGCSKTVIAEGCRFDQQEPRDQFLPPNCAAKIPESETQGAYNIPNQKNTVIGATDWVSGSIQSLIDDTDHDYWKKCVVSASEKSV